VIYLKKMHIYYYCYIAFCALNRSTNCVSHNLTLHISAFYSYIVFLYFVWSLQKHGISK